MRTLIYEIQVFHTILKISGEILSKSGGGALLEPIFPNQVKMTMKKRKRKMNYILPYRQRYTREN